jgi:serine/threonine-protein kinase
MVLKLSNVSVPGVSSATETGFSGMTEQESDGSDVRGRVKKEKVRFGQIAMNLGYINRKQLKIALGLQNKIRDAKGDAPTLGEILVRKGYLTDEERQHVYEKQGKLGGHTHIPDYDLVKKIGSGNMGTVYKAIQVKMERTVAIKVLAPRLAIEDKYIERFVREGKSVARLNHPNIIQGIDAGASNGVHYFVMEYVDGPTVESLIEDRGQLTCSAALNIVKQITNALEHAHKKNMIHRDVKPENIMVNSDGTAKLCDLGLASVVSSRNCENSGAGTPNYVSPEQALNDRQINIQTDIYSLGASLYQMITGTVPFTGEHPKEVMKKHVQKPLEPPSKLNDDIPGSVDDLVLTMMKKDRDQRYENPSQLQQQLDAIQGKGAADASDSGPDRSSRRRRLRQRRRRGR